MRYTAIIDDKTYTIEIDANNTVYVNGEPHTIDFRAIDNNTLYSLLMDSVSWEALVERNGDKYRVLIGGDMHTVTVMDERTRKIVKATAGMGGITGEAVIKAPMPGLVRRITVNVGDTVKAKQGMVILEAMKMENELRTPRGGTVKEICVQAGDKVEQGQTLVIVK